MAHRLSPAEDVLLQAFLNRLLDIAPAGWVGAVRVFGSRARGDSNEHSDLDVAVEATPLAERRRLADLVADAAWDAESSTDLIALGLSPLVVMPGPPVGLRASIARDGMTLWAAS